MTKRNSVQIHPRLSQSIYNALAKEAAEHGYMTESDEPNVTQFLRDGIIRTYLSLKNCIGMEKKKMEGYTTLETIRRATYLFVDDE